MALCLVAAADEVDELKHWREVTDSRIASICSTESIVPPPNAEVRYLSNDGDDAADGRSPATAWRTVERLSRENLAPGSYVLFRRGDVFRTSLDISKHPANAPYYGYAGGLRARAGVVYSAWGKGPKPRLTASPFDGADPARWAKSEKEGIWVCDLGHIDVGNIVFDGGAAHAIKIVPVYHKDGSVTSQYTRRPLHGGLDLDTDLHFYHDSPTNGIGRGTGMLYLHSRENPGKRFKSIEFGVRHNIITAHNQRDNVIDNLHLVCGGAHGIHGGGVNLLVKNCRFEWIGGGIQEEGLFGRAWGVRYGNCVEVGGCDGYTISNCWFRQVYDAAITHQAGATHWKKGKELTLYQRRIRYMDNVIEKCNYSIEYFLSRCKPSNPSRMEDFIISGNLMWDAGYGLCEQRPDVTQDAHLKSWESSNRATGFIVRDNVFARANSQFFQVCSRLHNPDGSDSMPRLERNLVLGRAKRLGAIEQIPDGAKTATYVPLDANSAAYLNRLGAGNRVENY